MVCSRLRQRPAAQQHNHRLSSGTYKTNATLETRFISTGRDSKSDGWRDKHTPVQAKTHATHTKAQTLQSHHNPSAVLNSASYGGKTPNRKKSPSLSLPCVPAHNPLWEHGSPVHQQVSACPSKWWAWQLRGAVINTLSQGEKTSVGWHSWERKRERAGSISGALCNLSSFQRVLLPHCVFTGARCAARGHQMEWAAVRRGSSTSVWLK